MKDEAESLTAVLDSVLLTWTVDIHKKRYVSIVDIPGAHLIM